MKPLLYATALFFLLDTPFTNDVAVTPAVIHTSIVDRRIVQLKPEVGTMCTTDYITVTSPDGSSKTRQSVDCDE
jgi:hypothetical protein